MGTVIQDQQQHNPERQPRWDRFERADLFAQYQKLRTQGISERQAAKELKVPRTTLQAWRMWHDTRAGRCWGLWSNSSTMAWIIHLPLEPGELLYACQTSARYVQR